MNKLRVLDLFSGIGGFALGLERAGMEVAAFCEIDPFCRAVLRKHWPDVPIYGDIREVKIDELPATDLICGGLPCQPFSCAGKRRGTADSRYLWPEMFRIIKAVRPRWVLGENVAGIVNLALDTVLSDLEGEGYETATFVIPACAVGAPHRRDRVWIVAYSSSQQEHTEYSRHSRPSERGRVTVDAGAETIRQTHRQACHDGLGRCGEDVAHSPSMERQPRAEEQEVLRGVPADGEECYNSDGSGEAQPREDVAYADNTRLQGYWRYKSSCQQPAWKNGATIERKRFSQPRLGGVLDGLPDWLDGHRWPAPCGCEQYEWEPPRVTTEKMQYRRQRLQALGNAVVPQIVEVIGHAILEAEKIMALSQAETAKI